MPTEAEEEDFETRLNLRLKKKEEELSHEVDEVTAVTGVTVVTAVTKGGGALE